VKSISFQGFCKTIDKAIELLNYNYPIPGTPKYLKTSPFSCNFCKHPLFLQHMLNYTTTYHSITSSRRIRERRPVGRIDKLCPLG